MNLDKSTFLNFLETRDPGAGAADVAPSKGRKPVGLLEAVTIFFRFFSPRFLFLCACASWCVRIWLARWTLWDVAVAAGLLAFWPFQEWMMHVYALHARTFVLFGRKRDLYVARMHRAHHRNPWKLPLVFIPWRVTVAGSFVITGFWHLLMPTAPLAWTGIAVYFTLAFHYEWSHYLPHSDYRPRSRHYRRICELHRLHHFKNENYWYGVSMTFGDAVLKTQPQKDSVPLSSTARSLAEA